MQTCLEADDKAMMHVPWLRASQSRGAALLPLLFGKSSNAQALLAALSTARDELHRRRACDYTQAVLWYQGNRATGMESELPRWHWPRPCTLRTSPVSQDMSAPPWLPVSPLGLPTLPASLASQDMSAPPPLLPASPLGLPTLPPSLASQDMSAPPPFAPGLPPLPSNVASTCITGHAWLPPLPGPSHWRAFQRLPLPGPSHWLAFQRLPLAGPSHWLAFQRVPLPGPSHWLAFQRLPLAGPSHWLAFQRLPLAGPSHWLAFQRLPLTVHSPASEFFSRWIELKEAKLAAEAAHDGTPGPPN
eukprot:352580-Chlamydomonas_euryale.AAC.2